MKRSTLRVGLVVSVLGLSVVAGCGSSSDDDASKSANGSDLEARLLADTGVRWIVDRDEASRPLFLTALDAPPPIAGATLRDRAAIEFFQRYADAFGAGTIADELVLKEDRDDPVAPGVHHLRFAQRIPGSDVRVFGADTFAHFDASGALRFAALGFVVDIGKIAPHPARSADEARDAAHASVRGRDAGAFIKTAKAPELVVHRAPDGKGTLAWRVVLEAMIQGALEAPEIFVDAATLAILEANDTAAHATRTVSASNVHRYHDECGRTPRPKKSPIEYDNAFVGPLAAAPTNRLVRHGDATKSTIITDRYIAGDLGTGTFFIEPTLSSAPESFDFFPNGHQGAGAAVSTHANLTLVDAYFRAKLGQRGWDDILPSASTGPVPIRAAVHAWTIRPKGPKEPPLPVNVVDIDGYLNEVIYLGDGTVNSTLGQPTCSFLPTGVALDLVAHEYTHGIVAFSARLGTVGEAGAINEGLADVLAAGAEHSVRPGDQNWIIAEDAWLAQGGLRNLRSPRALPATLNGEHVPRTYSERLAMEDRPDNDHGHVHDNAVIVGHAYYLMTEGGRNEKSNVEVPAQHALGWDRAQFLWYLTLRGLDRRFGTTIRSLARVNTNLSIFFGDVTAVACAWRAVEAFSDADLRDYRVTCGTQQAPPPPPPPPPPSSSAPPPPSSNPLEDVCVGRGDGLVCDTLEPSSASVCRNGVRMDTAFCADLGQVCKKASASDPTASTDPDGALVCE